MSRKKTLAQHRTRSGILFSKREDAGHVRKTVLHLNSDVFDPVFVLFGEVISIMRTSALSSGKGGDGNSSARESRVPGLQYPAQLLRIVCPVTLETGQDLVNGFDTFI